jgi:imidazolonepropionase-like amidohydrolase
LIPGDALVIRGGWLFDGTGDERVPNPGIVVADGRILRIGLSGGESLPEEVEILELEAEDTLLPGFFDLHAHYAVDFFGTGRTDETTVYPALFLGNGVTSTFPAGEVNPEEMRALRLRIEAGEQVGPRLFNSGPYYGTWRAGWDPEMTADSIRAEVDHWVGQGAHGFKAKGISPYHLEALIEAAHAHGRTVTGHLDSGFRNTVNPRDAILMGIDRVEHFVGGDAMPATRSAYASLVEMTPDMPEFREQVERFIEHGTFYNATLTAYGYFGAQDPEFFEYFWPEMDLLTPHTRREVEARLPREVNAQFEEIFRVKMGLLERFHDLGGGHLITLGTDHPSWGQFFSGFGVHREMHAMVAAGLPPASVLRIATLNGARALGVEDRLGTLEEGKLADMVVVRGDPLEDIRRTRNPPFVVKGGVVHDGPALLEGMRGRLGPEG